MRFLSPHSLVRGLSLGAAVVAVFTITGCSRPVGTVTGKVTYMDKPVRGGHVTFVSTDGGPTGTGEITEEGTYTIPNITAGSYKVCVETDSLSPQQRGPAMPTGANTPKTEKTDPNRQVPEGYTPSNPADASLAGANAKNAKRYVAIPDRYADSKTTDLTYTVVGGEQTRDLELK